MREQLQAALLVLAVGTAVAIGARRAGLPYNVALVVMGLVLVFMRVLPPAPLDPELILVVFVPVLVFEGALFADAAQMNRARRAILFLAVPGVIVSVLATALAARFALHIPIRPALLLGSLLSVTDAVSVLTAMRASRAPPRLAATIEGESLFNDGTGLVMVAAAVQLCLAGTIAPLLVARSLALATIGGLAVGALAGGLSALTLARTPDALTAILASVVFVFATALAADRVHASPVIAVVVLGIVIGRTVRRGLAPSQVLALEGFWESVGFALNVFVFLLVGMQIDARTLVAEAGPIAVALVAMHAGRALLVYGGFGLLQFVRREPVPGRWKHAMVAANIKGSLSMAAALALPIGVPYRARIVAITFGVTFATLVTQALPFDRILRYLRVVGTDEHRMPLEMARAALLAARRGQIELDGLLAGGFVSRREHAERWAAFQSRIVSSETTLKAHAVGASASVHVEASLLAAQKSAVIEAGRKGLVASDAVQAYVETIDTELVALRAREGE